MRRPLAVMAVFLFLACSQCLPATAHLRPSAKSAWRAQAPLPEARSDIVAVTVGSNIYIFGGCNRVVEWPADQPMYLVCAFDGPTSVSSDGFQYDPAKDSYTALPAAPNRRYRHASVALGGKIYLLGGADAFDNIVSAVDVFDTATNAWLAPIVFPNATSDLCAFVLGGSIYAAGGYDRPDYNPVPNVFRLTPGEALEWTPVAPLAERRGDVSAVVLRGLAVVSGGWSDANSYMSPVDTTEVYDPKRDRWTSQPNKSPRADFGMAVRHGLVLELGGEAKVASPLFPGGESYPRSDAHAYRVGGGSHARPPAVPSMPVNCYRFATATWRSKVFVFGGQCMSKGQNITVHAFYPLSNVTVRLG
jgi:N-acetylneuraminic acid mutarotase